VSSNNVAISVHQRLLNIRDQTGGQFNNLLLRFGLERLLYRLEAAGHSDSFILKGAMLFALWRDVPGRPTRDIDFLGLGNLSHEKLHSIFAAACGVKVVDDGMRFDSESIQTADIRDDQEYHGIRVRLLGFLGRARLPIQVDVGLGDAVTPEPVGICYPAILDFPVPRLRAYHPASVVAEKLNAMVVLGLMNSRLKDFYDIYMILKHMNIDDAILTDAIRATFERRNVRISLQEPAVFTDDFLEDGDKEAQWKAFLHRSALPEGDLPFSIVISCLKDRLWPILSNLAL